MLTTVRPTTLNIEDLCNQHPELQGRFREGFSAFIHHTHRQAIVDILSREWQLGTLSQNKAFLQAILNHLRHSAPLEKSTQFLALAAPSWN